MGRFASQVLHKLLLGFVISIVLRQFAHMPYSFLAIFPSVWRSKKKKAVGDVAAWVGLEDGLQKQGPETGYTQTPCSSFMVFRMRYSLRQTDIGKGVLADKLPILRAHSAFRVFICFSLTRACFGNPLRT